MTGAATSRGENASVKGQLRRLRRDVRLCERGPRARRRPVGVDVGRQPVAAASARRRGAERAAPALPGGVETPLDFNRAMAELQRLGLVAEGVGPDDPRPRHGSASARHPRPAAGRAQLDPVRPRRAAQADPRQHHRRSPRRSPSRRRATRT
ncbi:hypothetical protein ACRAWD_26620 [Caulobacter segnis]